MTESAMTEKPMIEDRTTEDSTTEKPTSEDLLSRIKRATNERLEALRGAVEERNRLQSDLVEVDPPDVDLASDEAVDEVDAQAQLYELSI